MFAANCFVNFVSNGTQTFRDASHGRYSGENEKINEIRAEMLGEGRTDAENVHHDWQMLGRDTRVALDKYIQNHE